MAENKAQEALKDAESKSNIKIKAYYSGDTPEDSGVLDLEYNLEPLDINHMPWLFKVYLDDAHVSQFVNAKKVYFDLSSDLGVVLDSVIVNAKQREAVELLVDKILYQRLRIDNANEGDIIV